MITDLVNRARQAPARWWWRLRRNARHRAHRREAGLTGPLSWYECYSLALEALELSLDADGDNVELALSRLFLPLSASEMTKTAVAMAVLARPGFMGSLAAEDIEVMRLQLAMHWEPEMDT
jgi:hypothetical protein